MGEWNHVEGFVGDRGSGKSTAAILRAMELARGAGGAYVLAWDPAHRMPASLPGGRRSPIVDARSDRWPDVGAAIISARGGIVRVPSIDGGTVLEIGRRLGRSGKAPALVVIDECALWDDSSPRGVSPSLQGFLAVCRHDRCGLLWCAQSAGMVHRRVIAMSTRLMLFRQAGAADRARLKEGTVPDEIIARLPSLKPHESITYPD